MHTLKAPRLTRAKRTIPPPKDDDLLPGNITYETPIEFAAAILSSRISWFEEGYLTTSRNDRLFLCIEGVEESDLPEGEDDEIGQFERSQLITGLIGALHLAGEL